MAYREFRQEATYEPYGKVDTEFFADIISEKNKVNAASNIQAKKMAQEESSALKKMLESGEVWDRDAPDIAKEQIQIQRDIDNAAALGLPMAQTDIAERIRQLSVKKTKTIQDKSIAEALQKRAMEDPLLKRNVLSTVDEVWAKPVNERDTNKVLDEVSKEPYKFIDLAQAGIELGKIKGDVAYETKTGSAPGRIVSTSAKGKFIDENGQFKFTANDYQDYLRLRVDENGNSTIEKALLYQVNKDRDKVAETALKELPKDSKGKYYEMAGKKYYVSDIEDVKNGISAGMIAGYTFEPVQEAMFKKAQESVRPLYEAEVARENVVKIKSAANRASGRASSGVSITPINFTKTADKQINGKEHSGIFSPGIEVSKKGLPVPIGVTIPSDDRTIIIDDTGTEYRMSQIKNTGDVSRMDASKVVYMPVNRKTGIPLPKYVLKGREGDITETNMKSLFEGIKKSDYEVRPFLVGQVVDRQIVGNKEGKSAFAAFEAVEQNAKPLTIITPLSRDSKIKLSSALGIDIADLDKELASQRAVMDRVLNAPASKASPKKKFNLLAPKIAL